MYLPISLNDHPSERQNQKAPVDIPKSHRLERMACFCENVLKIWKFSLQEHTKFSLVPPPLQEKPSSLTVMTHFSHGSISSNVIEQIL